MIHNLFGLGSPSTAEIQHAADTLVSTTPQPSSEAIRAYLLTLPNSQWKDAGFALIARGVSPITVGTGLQLAQATPRLPWKAITGALTVASAAVSAYHGTRRNESIAWGLWWFTMGILFPIVTPVIAVAQGYGQRKEK